MSFEYEDDDEDESANRGGPRKTKPQLPGGSEGDRESESSWGPVLRNKSNSADLLSSCVNYLGNNPKLKPYRSSFIM